MKKLSCLVAFMAALTPALAGSLHDLDAKYGFRDVPFESPLNDAFVPVGGADAPSSPTYFMRPTDDLHIGGAALTDITYVFWRQRFEGVMINAEGATNCNALHDAFSEAYGGGVQTNRFVEQYFWWGKKVGGSFEYSSVSGKCMGLFESKPMRKEHDRDDAEAAKRAKKDL